MSVRTVFRGWWVVAGCQVVAVIAWSLGLFGAGVYLHALREATGLSIGLISSAMTSCYLLAAFAQVAVGGAIDRFGPAPVLSFGACAMAAAVAALGQAGELWQIYAAFLVLGLGWACLSTTALSTTLAPWFDRYHGRAVSTALLGASIGGMIGAPALLFGIARWGLAATMLGAGAITLIVILPIASLLLRHRPQDLGLTPDGLPLRGDLTEAIARRWTRAAALRTVALATVIIAFGLGLLVQIGFLTHQVPLLLPTLGVLGASATVAATAFAAFAGRLMLARFSDGVDVRFAAFAMLALAAIALFAMALLLNGPASMAALSIVYGFTTGNLTTLAPIIVRREFGALSFGAVYGTAASGVQLLSALGPSFFGVLYDSFDGYGPALLIAAVLDLAAGALILLGARRLQAVR